MAAAEASRIALEQYGFKASARALPGEYDDNFHLVDSNSREFVLKVMHVAREESFVDMQCGALTHLAERAPRLALPRVIPNASTKLFSKVPLPEGSTRLVQRLDPAFT